MREPRAKQRFPTNGKELYELLRLDYEPILLWVCTHDEAQQRYVQPDTLIYDRVMDPMLYFWPVESQHVVVRSVSEPETGARKRLVKALLRDGALWVTVLWNSPEVRVEHFGDAGTFAQHRYGTVDALALPGGRSRPD